MRTNSIVILCLSIAMGGVAAFLTHGWLQSHTRTTSSTAPDRTIVVASAPLAFGAALTDDNVTEIKWAATALPDGAFSSKQDLLKDGRRVVLSPLNRNEPVLQSKITQPGQRASLSSLVQDGMRAVTLRVDDVRGVAGFILPGDYVDVVLIGEGSSSKRESYSEILLHHVKVLAIDQLASERQEHPTVAKAVTVEVTPDQAQKILLAANVGKLSLILRQPDDPGLQSSKRITEADLGFRKPAEPVRIAPPPPPPPPPVSTRAVAPPPTNTATVAIVHGMKREEFTVRRSEE